MATDPVESVVVSRLGERAEDLVSVVRRLAALEPSAALPYLTAGIDLSPEGGNPERSPGRDLFGRAVMSALAAMAAHDPARLSLEAALATVAADLDRLPPAVRGAFVVAGGPQPVTDVVATGLPLPNRVDVGPTPRLLDLVRLADDERPFLVLAADQRDAALLVVTDAVPDLQIAVETDPFPRKQQQGGWSQQRYQARADERVDAFARTLAQEARRLVEGGRVDAVVISADEPMRSALINQFHPSVGERVVGDLPGLLGVDPDTVVERARPLVEAAERADELAAAKAVDDGAGPGGRSVGGAAETLAALQTGQVLTLVMNDDFAMSGWADFALGAFGVGEPPAAHPAGGDPAALVGIAVEQEAVRLALLSDAAIEIVRSRQPVAPDEAAGRRTADAGRSEAARLLDKFGGIGATLRFTLSGDRSTADL